MADAFDMPIINRRGERLARFTWMPTKEDRAQAERNHGQTLERLRERGGVDWGELAAILEHCGWDTVEDNDNEARCRMVLARRAPLPAAPSQAEGDANEAMLAALKLFGYAPGGYTIICASCGGVFAGASGRYCYCCAEERLNEVRAALSVLPRPEADGWSEALTDEVVGKAMSDAWNDICADSGHHPQDITRQGHARELFFEPRHWAQYTAMFLRRALSRRPSSDRVRHVKRGTEYDVIARGVELQDASGMPACEGTKMTIYRGDDGKWWAREDHEFADGRFVPSSPAPEKS